MQISPLEAKDLDLIPEINPPDWGDISQVFRRHLDQDYFYAIKVTDESQLIGVGELMILENSAWLGNIVVREAARGRGVGKMITEHLMQKGISKGKNLFLLATPAGEIIYRKLGFQECGRYLFFKRPEGSFPAPTRPDPNIRRFDPVFLSEILQMDLAAMGEDRSRVLIRFLYNAWVYTRDNRRVEGFYLPDLGEGLVIAQTAAAGMSLLQLREGAGKPVIVIPEEHAELAGRLTEREWTVLRPAYMMRFGEMKAWKPGMVYSRVGGYLG